MVRNAENVLTQVIFKLSGYIFLLFNKETEKNLLDLSHKVSKNGS